MFQPVPCTLELSRKFGLENYDFTLSVQFEAEQRLPLSKFELYSYTTAESTYYYGFRQQKVIMHEVAICSIGPFKEEELLKGFSLFFKKVGLFEPRQPLLFMGDEHLIKPLIPIFEQHNLNREEYPDVYFYMTKEREELLMKTESLPVPEGYVLGSCSPEEATLIANAWAYKTTGEDEQTRMKITVFPSSCIRYQGKPVAFELVHANGMQNHLYVDPEHRGKDLGFIVEQDLARKQIKAGLRVYKTVGTFKESLVKHSNESPFWTMMKKEDGNPLIKLWLAVWPKEKDLGLFKRS